MKSESTSSRRRFLRLVLAAPVLYAIGLRFRWLDDDAAADALLAVSSSGKTPARPLPATPECGDDDEPTPRQTEGPFYTPRTPQRTNLVEPGMAGTKVVVTGRVFSRGCRPVAGAMLDFWQADDAGEYDNEGFRLRGHQFADKDGRYRLETVVPGLYPGRTRHIHVRVQPRGGRILTTQLYFPGEARNRNDGIFRPELLMSVRDGAPKHAQFNFVLDVS